MLFRQCPDLSACLRRPTAVLFAKAIVFVGTLSVLYTADHLVADPIDAVKSAAVADAPIADELTVSKMANLRDITETVNTCFVTVESASKVTAIAVEVAIDAAGHLERLPVLVEPKRPRREERLLFRRVLDAFAACQPFPARLANTRAEISFDGAGAWEPSATAALDRAATSDALAALGELAPAASGTLVSSPPPVGDGETDVASVDGLVSPADPAPGASPIGPDSAEEADSVGTDVAGLPPDGPPATMVAPSDETTEAALALNRGDRREVQRRLTLLGFRTRGVDGIFGPGTRNAIVGWQEKQGFAATGYLDVAQLDRLRAMTDGAYRRWLRAASEREREREREQASERARQGNPTGRFIDADGCLREPNGAYVANFKPDCP